MRIFGDDELKIGENNEPVIFVGPADSHGALMEFKRARPSSCS